MDTLCNIYYASPNANSWKRGLDSFKNYNEFHGSNKSLTQWTGGRGPLQDAPYCHIWLVFDKGVTCQKFDVCDPDPANACDTFPCTSSNATCVFQVFQLILFGVVKEQITCKNRIFAECISKCRKSTMLAFD